MLTTESKMRQLKTQIFKYPNPKASKTTMQTCAFPAFLLLEGSDGEYSTPFNTAFKFIELFLYSFKTYLPKITSIVMWAHLITNKFWVHPSITATNLH